MLKQVGDDLGRKTNIMNATMNKQLIVDIGTRRSMVSTPAGVSIFWW
jgi:hypothetical protein